MSFFFTKKTKPAPRGATPAQAGKASKETLNRLGCRACPLDKANNCTPKMLPDTVEDTEVYFLGDGPNETDDKKGAPFSSKAGKLLKSILGSFNTHSFDNVVRDYRDSLADKHSPAWVAMECCRSLVVKSIEKAKPRIIVGLGILPLQFMLNSSDMVGLRGRVFAVKVGQHKCWFMPTYHPQYIIDTAYDDATPLRSKLGHCLKFDVARAVSLADQLPTPTIDTPEQARAGVQAFNGRGRTQLAQVLSLISEARKAREKAIDLETSHLRPYAADARVLTVALSYDDTNFAFAMDHPKAGWSPDDKKALKAALKELLADPTTIIAHNAPFEIEWLITLLGKDAIWHDVWDCTMMQSHFLDERRGKRGGNDNQFQPNPYQALDFLVKQHFGLAYKALFKLDRKNMAKADLDETLLYNGADTKYTLRLFRNQTDRLKQDGLLAAYREARERQPTVALIQTLGIDVDQHQNKVMQKKLGGEIEAIQQRIGSYPEVQAFIKDRKTFNIGSTPDVLKLLKDYIRSGVPLVNSDGKESVDKVVLAKINHPIGKDIEEFRNRSKLKSTYVDVFEYGKGAFIHPDGRIHQSLNTTFAETGRTSCTAYWTPITTARGELPIRDVRVGDLVWTHKKRWQPVTALWRKGWEVMLNLRLSNGSVLTCTKNHRMLSADGQWVTAGEIYGLFQEMGSQGQEPRSRTSTLSKQADPFSGPNSGKTGHTRLKRLVDNTQLCSSRGIQGTEAPTLLNVENWRQKPDERFDREPSPKVERNLRRRLWLQDYKARGETNLLSSLDTDESFGVALHTEGLGSTSHRRRPAQQYTRQFSFGNVQGASSNPPATAPRFEIITVEEIEVGGSCEVFDITVAEDSSYLACGIISHNSDSPNNQNWPSRNDKWVRRQVVARKGHVLLAFDFGQLEGCTGAMCSKDKTFVKALWEDYDMHMEWAQRAAALHPAYIGGSHNYTDKNVMKKFRSLIKNKMVFPAFFGAAKESIAGYLAGATGVEAPKYVIDKLFDEFWTDFRGTYNWQKRLMSDYYEVGYVESPTGRRRHYPLGRPQAINFPVQSVACDIVCRAMCTLSIEAAVTGKWWLHPILNVHDDLSFSVPDQPQILEEAIETIYRTMLAPAYNFINVPLSTTCSIGTNWLEMEEIGKFWSHKNL